MESLIRILVVFTLVLCVPVQAEREGKEGAEEPPEVITGERPDGYNPYAVPEVEPERDHSKDMALLAAVVVTLFSAYHAKKAAKTSAEAFWDMFNRKKNKPEFKPIVEAFDKIKKEQPKTAEAIEQLGKDYRSAWDGLSTHLKGPRRPPSIRRSAQAVDTQLRSLLSLPTIKDNEAVKTDLSKRLESWYNEGNMKPILDWIAENKTKDILGDPVARAWHRELERLRWELARGQWKENKTLSGIDSWLGSDSLTPEMRADIIPDSWVSEYHSLKGAEEGAAKKLVGEVEKFTTALSKELGPEATGPLLTLGDETRQPGTLQQVKGDKSKAVPARKAGTTAKKNCGHWFAALEKAAEGARSRYAIDGIIVKLVWPATPVAVGLGGGGYFTFEGLRHYFTPTDEPEKTKDEKLPGDHFMKDAKTADDNFLNDEKDPEEIATGRAPW